MIEKFRGDDIYFDISGTGQVDLDDMDFEVVLQRPYDAPIRLAKADCSLVEAGMYRCLFPAADTDTWPIGKYDLYIRLMPTYAIAKCVKDFILLNDYPDA